MLRKIGKLINLIFLRKIYTFFLTLLNVKILSSNNFIRNEFEFHETKWYKYSTEQSGTKWFFLESTYHVFPDSLNIWICRELIINRLFKINTVLFSTLSKSIFELFKLCLTGHQVTIGSTYCTHWKHFFFLETSICIFEASETQLLFIYFGKPFYS